ncbi:MAG: hypothetical protein CMH65_08370 [Nevskiales bacterium]|nr:hypothetical protein [Nevskiales bacterium]
MRLEWACDDRDGKHLPQCNIHFCYMDQTLPDMQVSQPLQGQMRTLPVIIQIVLKNQQLSLIAGG